ncbi:LysR family transcriptional regulator [Paraburkholderia sp. BL6665CI2N2]|uniref:LysR family transcriptional regulator n=1 Tax=Paraburkholderia sp. BL6665CI2N2 TaxID=1938806 RepID=UPI0010651F9A|nr:LysR family transcriptional regulator [Paraburkholderia sp. BL6665CI2N2]
MDRIHAMKVFTRIVDANSFSRAADMLNLPRASVTNIIQKLEAYLKVRLLQRTTRKLSLTPDGAAYYERCVRTLAAVEEAENAFRITSKIPRGRLRIDMPGALGRRLVMPTLIEFHSSYPALELALGFHDRRIDLIQEGVDCAIRMGALDDSGLVARRIGVVPCVTAVAPGYLALHGAPQTVEALKEHTAVKCFIGQSERAVDFDFLLEAQAVQVKMQGMVAVNDAEAYLSCGVNGLGIIQVPLFMASPHLKTGELVEVLPGFKPLPQPISAVYPHKLHLSSNVSVFVDWITELFARRNLGEDGREVQTSTMKIWRGRSEFTGQRMLTQARPERLYA